MEFSKAMYARVGLGAAITEAENQWVRERSGDVKPLEKPVRVSDSIGDLPVQKRLAGITKYERGAFSSSGCMPLSTTHARGMLDESDMTDLKALGVVPSLPRLYESARPGRGLLREWSHAEGKAVLSMLSRLKMVYEAEDDAAIDKVLYDLRAMLADLDDSVDELEVESKKPMEVRAVGNSLIQRMRRVNESAPFKKGFRGRAQIWTGHEWKTSNVEILDVSKQDYQVSVDGGPHFYVGRKGLKAV